MWVCGTVKEVLTCLAIVVRAEWPVAPNEKKQRAVDSDLLKAQHILSNR